MRNLTYGRLFRNARYFAGVLACLFALTTAHAVDTSQCGYILAENYIATHLTTSPCKESSASTKCSIRHGDIPASGVSPNLSDGCLGAHTICVQYQSKSNSTWHSVSSSTDCDCSSQPSLPGSTVVATLSGSAGFRTCRSGCTYRPNVSGPQVCTGAPVTLASGGAGTGSICENSGGWSSDGTNCDPVNPDQPVQPPVSSKSCKGSSIGEICLEPYLPPSQPPQICATVAGGTSVCAPNPGCGGSQAAGTICAGDPPPTPPPPPQTPPSPNNPNVAGPPPVSYPANQNCIGSGARCQPVVVNIWPPNTSGGGNSGPNCGPGWHVDGSSCAPDANPCSDGSQPVNGQCHAPPANCSDGSTPVNGSCNAPGNGNVNPDGSCPNGGTAYNGVCYGNCPDGTTPVHGQCTAPSGTCPNGAQPVAGMCPSGTCNPATDPNACQGNNSGNAGGGGTCDAPPFCTGDAINCQILQQQWQTKCAIEGLGKVTGTPPDGHAGEEPGDTNIVHDDSAGLLGQLNANGFLGGGQCPVIPSFTMMGHSFDFSANPWWCTALSAIGGVILFVGAFLAMRILLGA